ncbi:MAG: hypothetical protein QXO70_02590 [Candidatus Pacearchaeota archaeon]
MTITKKHFKKIAEILKKHRNSCACSDEEFSNLFNDMADFLNDMNERFNFDRFKNAVFQATPKTAKTEQKQ